MPGSCSCACWLASLPPKTAVVRGGPLLACCSICLHCCLQHMHCGAAGGGARRKGSLETSFLNVLHARPHTDSAGVPLPQSWPQPQLLPLLIGDAPPQRCQHTHGKSFWPGGSAPQGYQHLHKKRALVDSVGSRWLRAHACRCRSAVWLQDCPPLRCDHCACDGATGGALPIGRRQVFLSCCHAYPSTKQMRTPNSSIASSSLQLPAASLQPGMGMQPRHKKAASRSCAGQHAFSPYLTSALAAALRGERAVLSDLESKAGLHLLEAAVIAVRSQANRKQMFPLGLMPALAQIMRVSVICCEIFYQERSLSGALKHVYRL